MLGTVGEISPEQLRGRIKQGYRAGDRIGQSGVEAAYDRYLRGRPGLAQLRVDSLGRPRGDFTPRQMPQPGNAPPDAGRGAPAGCRARSLREWIASARGQSDCVGCWAASRGAIVALDPRDGAVLAMASSPTYHPEVYVGRVDPHELERAGLTGATAKERNYPALNRAIAGEYPAGSTWKPVTALAAMEEHLIAPYSLLPCTPDMVVDGKRFANWRPLRLRGHDAADRTRASCDTYFYRVGLMFYNLPRAREPVAGMGVEARLRQDGGPGHRRRVEGLLPTPQWRRETYTKKTDPCCWQVDRLWKSGDSVQLAIGQKDLLVTPLQLARFYALIANGGRLDAARRPARRAARGLEGSAPSCLRRLGAAPPATWASTGRRSTSSGRASWSHARARGHLDGRVRELPPVSISGKVGTAERRSFCPAGRAASWSTSRGGAATGPRTPRVSWSVR